MIMRQRLLCTAPKIFEEEAHEHEAEVWGAHAVHENHH